MTFTLSRFLWSRSPGHRALRGLLLALGRQGVKRASSFLAVAYLITILPGCAPQTKAFRPDWQNIDHQRAGAQLVQLLRSSGRDPAACKIFLFETASLNAVSLGGCTFGFSTGLVETRDERLIRGVAAHEVAHEVLGHADKRKAAVAAEQAIRTAVSFIPGVGGLIATSAVMVAGMLALPAYSRSQEAEADEKAVEILQRANDHDPTGTMAYTFRTLLAWQGPKGGGLLDTHPGTEDRLADMVKLQRQQGPDRATPIGSTPKEPAPTRASAFKSGPLVVGTVERRGKDNAEMVYIPGGTFTMGDTHGDGDSDEKPTHQVVVADFWLDKTEITNAQFAQFIQSGNTAQGEWRWEYTSGKDQHPVVNVTWHDALAYCLWADKRLPTEAEWEYAARGTDGRKYPWGNTWEDSRVRFTGNRGNQTTASVGSYPSGASPFGVFDLAGNVSEWVGSLYESYPYSATDGRENLRGSGLRVFRGGSWSYHPGFLRSADRNWCGPTYRNFSIGFRCAQGVQ